MDALDGACRDDIRRTIEYLAGVCDHASSRDDVGFSANTASLGHELAHLPDRYWNDGTYVAAARIAHKHRQQAIGANVLQEDAVPAIQAVANGPDHQEEVASAWMVTDASRDGVVLSVSKEMADVVRTLKALPGAMQPAGKGRLWAVDGTYCFALLPYLKRFSALDGAAERLQRSARGATPDMIIAASSRVIDALGDVFVLSFPYDKETVNEVKALRRRRYDGKCWQIEASRQAAELLVRLKDDMGFLPTSAASSLIETSLNRGDEPDVPRPGPAREISSLRRGDNVILAFKYDPELIDLIKALPTTDRYYNSGNRTWSVGLHCVPQLVEWLQRLERPIAEESLERLTSLVPAAPAP